jgi:hypothetical protein
VEIALIRIWVRNRFGGHELALNFLLGRMQPIIVFLGTTGKS